jgi:hypothetical protein
MNLVFAVGAAEIGFIVHIWVVCDFFEDETFAFVASAEFTTLGHHSQTGELSAFHRTCFASKNLY